MSELYTGECIRISNGSRIRVIEELGRGGQGIVYRVDLNGTEMALKWYFDHPGKDFRRNLEYNVNHKSPSPSFLWPKYLTDVVRGSFGYVMDLRPLGYFEFGKFLCAKVRFKSEYARLVAALKICDGFKYLHLEGYSYQDLNDGNFFINQNTGDVLICDNDNVSPQGENTGIIGKVRYIAPEIVVGKKMPDKYTDRYSLTVILFLLFFHNHPLEGKKVHDCPCLTESKAKSLYGSDATFIYDDADKTNRPVPGLDVNVINRWPSYPKFVREVFKKEFSKEIMFDNPTRRKLDEEWKKTILAMTDHLMLCPHCHNYFYGDVTRDEQKCECGHVFTPYSKLVIGKRTIPLTENKTILLQTDSEHFVTTVQKKDNNVAPIWVSNTLQEPIYVTTTKGEIRTIKPNESFPAKKGLKFAVNIANNQIKGEII